MGFSCTENSDLNDPYSDLFINKYGPIQRKSRPFDGNKVLRKVAPYLRIDFLRISSGCIYANPLRVIVTKTWKWIEKLY